MLPSLSTSSTNPVPPPDWMLPDFDPNAAKVSELRSILLENNIPHSYTRKSNLVQLFERQVKPIAPKLLREHLNVKPSAQGIIDMRTGRALQVGSPGQSARSPRKKASPINLTDQESSASTTSRRRTKQPSSSTRSAQELEQAASEADVESTPLIKSRRVPTTLPKSKPSATLATPRRIGKRKADERTLQPEDEDEVDQLARDSDPNDLVILDKSQSKPPQTSASASMKQASTSPIPIKRRRSEFPIQPSTTSTPLTDEEPSIAGAKKKASRPKNRRTTMHEAIEAKDANFSDFNPFQSGPEDEKSGSSSQKPRPSSKRQSSVSRPSIVPAQLPKSSTTSNISSFDTQTHLPRTNPPPLPIHVPQSATTSAGPAFLPKSVTTSNVRAVQTPHGQQRKSIGPGSLPPGNRRITMVHLQDEIEGTSSEQCTPEQIYRLLVPNRRSESERERHSERELSNEPDGRRDSPRPAARRQSQLPPHTPYPQSVSALQQTPLPRPTIQRIRLDELVHTPSEKKLKIRRAAQAPAPRRGLLLFSPSQLLGFLLRLGCLGLMVAVLSWYREQSLRLGYCDTGRTSNAATRDQQLEQVLAAEADVDEGAFAGVRARVAQLAEAASAVGLLPDCTSCPAHALCDRGKLMRCERDYVLRHSAWSEVVHSWLPMVMGPQCVPDTARLVKIVETAHGINQILKQRRGAVLCGMGMRATDEAESGRVDVQTYGMSVADLKELLKPHEARWTEAEDEIFDLAIKDLEKYSEVVSESGWLATSNFKLMDLSLKCKLKLGVLKMIKKFKLILVGVAFGLVGWLYVKIKMNQINEEKRKVKELVELALTKLRDESWTHHTNPSHSSQPTIASAHLRDLILAYDHSPLNRQKVWKKVERVVEGNSNVRTKVSEIRGESIKVWEWIGSYGGGKSEMGYQQHQPFNNTHHQAHQHHYSSPQSLTTTPTTTNTTTTHN